MLHTIYLSLYRFWKSTRSVVRRTITRVPFQLYLMLPFIFATMTPQNQYPILVSQLIYPFPSLDFQRVRALHSFQPGERPPYWGGVLCSYLDLVHILWFGRSRVAISHNQPYSYLVHPGAFRHKDMRPSSTLHDKKTTIYLHIGKSFLRPPFYV